VGENSKAKWWGYRGQVVGISRSTGGGNYQGQVVGISRSSSGDIKAKWWGYQGQGEGLRGQGKKKSGGGCVPSPTPSTQLVNFLYFVKPNFCPLYSFQFLFHQSYYRHF
jgi:hypothetical protein